MSSRMKMFLPKLVTKASYMHPHYGIKPICNVIEHKRVNNHHYLPHRSTSLVPPYSSICIFHSIRGALQRHLQERSWQDMKLDDTKPPPISKVYISQT